MLKRISLVATTTALATVVVACGSTGARPDPGDVAFARGEFAAAAAAFLERAEADAEPLSNEQRLRLALALAVPGHPSSDPARARELLEQLDHGESRSAEAAAVLSLVDRMAHLDRELVELADRLRRADDAGVRCAEQAAKLRGELWTSRLEVEDASAERDRLRREINELESAIARRDAELAELQQMLERLKHVDLEQDP